MFDFYAVFTHKDFLYQQFYDFSFILYIQVINILMQILRKTCNIK